MPRPLFSRSLAIPSIAIAVTLISGVLATPARAEDGSIVPSVPQTLPASVPVPTDQFIVGVKERAGVASLAAGQAAERAAAMIGAPAHNLRPATSGAQIIKMERVLSAAEGQRFLAALLTDPNIEYAEPDAVMQTAAAEPNDSLYGLQWDLWEDRAGLRAPGAWAMNRGEGVVVAVVDTGILGHSDLDANVLPGYDMMSDSAAARDGDGRDADPTDEGDWISAGQCTGTNASSISSWHGTHVAGTIASVANNMTGVVGVAPASKILPLRALGPCGGYTSDIADSIIWAAGGTVPGTTPNANPAKVINLSLGGINQCSVTYQNAINYAFETGAAVVVAAGNSNRPAADSSPANCQNVITVAASTRSGARAPYSNYGSAVDVTAPGGDMRLGTYDGILSTSNFGTTTRNEEAYEFMQGTSMAAPHVAGVAALISSELGPRSAPRVIEERLKSTSRSLVWGCTGGCGSGLVDAAAALNFQLDVPTTSGVPVISGFASVGHTLEVSPGTWSPQGIILTYQWQRDGLNIAGATSASYTVNGADLGTKLTVAVTGSRLFMDGVTATSPPTASVSASELFGPIPLVTVTSHLGYLLTVSPGSWEPAPVVLSYQWKRSGENIPGATGLTYQSNLGDLGHGLSVEVTGNKAGYAAVQRASAAFEVPAPSVVVVPQPATFADNNGTDEDTYTIPEFSAADYLVGGVAVEAGTYRGVDLVEVVARPKTGYAFPINAITHWSHTFKATPYEVTPAVVVFTDKDGTAEDTYTVPAMDGVEYLVGNMVVEPGTYPGVGTVTVKARAKADYVLSEGAAAEWTATFKATTYEVTPAVVVFTDKDGTAEDTYTVPATDGVEYLVGDEVVEAGTYPGSGTVTVKARAKVDYVLADGAPAAWSATFQTTTSAYEPPTVSPFIDIFPSQQFYKEMAWLAERKISTGWTESDGSRTYRALQPISRDAMAAFLYRMAGSPDYTAPAVSPFADVLTGQQFYKEMAWLAERKISTGWTEGNGTRYYKPLEPISRDAMAAFLYRMSGSPAYSPPAVSPFVDIAPGQQFYREMSWLAANGISTGWSEGNGTRYYKPLQPISRDAMAAFLFRLDGLPD